VRRSRALRARASNFVEACLVEEVLWADPAGTNRYHFRMVSQP
jgi:hypothetical protein